MALTRLALRQLRAELGKATETGIDDDATLELIYDNEGGESILLTSWYVWKRRLGDLQTRAFDVTTGGTLMARRQRIGFIQSRISELEFSLGAEDLARSRAHQDDVQSTYQINEDLSDTEFS